jgi:poly(3-hydroxybutyrate) depolymerase
MASIGGRMITRRRVSLSVVAALGALAVRTGHTQSQPTPEQLIRRPVVYSVPGMANVRVREGLVYKSVEGSQLHFDVYAPASVSRASPAVILVHGGPIPSIGACRWGLYTSHGRLLAASGMTGVAFDHRFLAPDRLRDSAADLADLVREVRENAKTLGIDQNRMALWAFSGGGSLLANALRERQSWWKLLVAYYGVMEPLETGHDERLSAIATLGRDASKGPPILLARAGRDDPAINSTIDRFVACGEVRRCEGGAADAPDRSARLRYPRSG